MLLYRLTLTTWYRVVTVAAPQTTELHRPRLFVVSDAVSRPPLLDDRLNRLVKTTSVALAERQHLAREYC